MNSIATTICTKLAKLAPEKLVEVYNPGGKVMCRVNTDLSGVELIGNATYQFAGQFEFNFEKWKHVQKKHPYGTHFAKENNSPY